MTGVRKVVYAASGGTLYGEPRKLPVKETANGRPVSPYGISKKVGIDYLVFYERYQGSRSPPRARERLRPASGSRRRGGRRRDLRLDDARGRGAHDLRRRPPDARLRIRRRRRPRLRARRERGGGRLVNVGTGLETSVNGLYQMLAQITGFEGAPVTARRAGDLRRNVLGSRSPERSLAGGHGRISRTDWPRRSRS